MIGLMELMSDLAAGFKYPASILINEIPTYGYTVEEWNKEWERLI